MMKVVLFLSCLVVVKGLETTVASTTEKVNRTEHAPESGISESEKTLLTKIHGEFFRDREMRKIIF